jgi:hypothetical protein
MTMYAYTRAWRTHTDEYDLADRLDELGLCLGRTAAEVVADLAVIGEHTTPRLAYGAQAIRAEHPHPMANCPASDPGGCPDWAPVELFEAPRDPELPPVPACWEEVPAWDE